MTALEPGNLAPSFSLPGDDGKTHAFPTANAGKGTLIFFFKTECPTCQLTMPFVERLFQRLRGGPIGFVAVGQNDEAELDPFRKRFGLSFPVAMESAPWQASNAYGITNVPSFFLVDAAGKVVKNLVGHSKPGLEELLQAASKLAGVATPTPLFTDADAGVRAFQPG